MSTRAAPARRRPRSAAAPNAETQRRSAAHNAERYRNVTFIRPSFLYSKRRAARVAVGIHPDLALVVEDHQSAFLGSKRGPFGKAGMVGIAFPRERDPGIGHAAAEFAGFGTAAGHGRGAIGVIEDEGE